MKGKYLVIKYNEIDTGSFNRLKNLFSTKSLCFTASADLIYQTSTYYIVELDLRKLD